MSAVAGATSRVLSTEELFPAGRDLDWSQLRRQLGMNLLAISGGKALTAGASSVVLPAGAGFQVIITLEADDTYTVRRAFKRGGKWFDHGVRRDVYCDQVAEVAYYASCHVSYGHTTWIEKA